jgi:ArsR family transcriptional regulator
MDTKRLAKILKALSNPNRLELYFEIARKQEAGYQTEKGECYIADIINCINIGAPTISHHLKELSNADLIITERKGKYLVARINEKTLKQIEHILISKKV